MAIVIIGFFISIIGFSLIYRIVNNAEILQREQDMRFQIQSINHPATAQQLELRIGSKIVKRWLSATYKYSMSDNEVEIYYEKELSKDGWLKTRTMGVTNERYRGSVYVKGKYELAIEPIGNDKGCWELHLNYKDFFDKWGL